MSAAISGPIRRAGGLHVAEKLHGRIGCDLIFAVEMGGAPDALPQGLGVFPSAAR